MPVSQDTRLWYAQHYPIDARLVILHPGFDRQQLLIKDVLRRSLPAFCLTLEGAQSTLAHVWTALQGLLSDSVGAALADLPTRSGQIDPRRAAQMLHKIAKPLGSHVLVIDSYDLAHDEALDDFVIALAEMQDEGSQIVIGTRRLPLGLAEKSRASDILRGATVLFPVDESKMLIDYLHRESTQTLLEVYAQGAGLAVVNGRVIEHWDGVLPRALFFYLIDRGMTTRDEIFQTFWPDLTVREATNVFHVTKRKISEILGFDLTVYWSGFYRISPDIDLEYDVVRFGENVQNSAVASDEDAMTLLEDAVYLWHGTFLTKLDSIWARNRRDDLRNTYIEALTALARLYEYYDQPERALGMYHRAVMAMPHREDVARAIMSLYAKLGQTERAIAAYERLAADLKRKFDLAPDRRTLELAREIGYTGALEPVVKPRSRGKSKSG